MKKTLLIAAAALAVGMTSVQAQNVYSQNVVGYYNITIPSHKYYLVANQLVNGSDVNQTNNNVQTVLKTGFISDPAGVNNTILYYWNGGGYNLYFYYTDLDAQNQFDPTFGDGWYDGSGNFANVSLTQGAGHFLYNPSSVPITNSLVGTVYQGTNVLSVVNGYNTYASISPTSTTNLVNFPGTSDPTGANNDILYLWNGNGYNLLFYYTDLDAQNQFDPTYGDGWYDGSGNFGSYNPSLWPKVGQGFFLHHTGATKLWTNSFVIPQ